MDSFRQKKADELRASGGQPYASSFERTHSLLEARDSKEETTVTVSGRIMLLRDMGKMTFLTLQDQSGRLQMVLREEDLGAKEYAEALHLLDLGDIIGIEGTRFATKKGEPSVLAKKCIMLSKALRQPPEKWHGIADQETVWRQRYLDLTSNRETFDRFQFRSRFLQKLREFYWQHSFTEVETPILVNAASGALATPFQTHHKAYDLDMFLRIAPETFLKECLVGGFDRVFEIGRIFRNEGLDPSHLQDFTMVEHYSAYWNYVKNMEFTETMLSTLLNDLLGTTKVKIPDRDGKLIDVDFAPPWPRLSICQAINDACGIDFEKFDTASALREAIKSKKIAIDVNIETLGRGNLIDQLYKKVSRPSLVQPTFIIQHPIDLSPLARRNDNNPNITDRFQLVVGGWEIVNAYSELIDPVDQAKRFEEQAKANAGGDSDAHRKDDEYVTALEYGCPPCSGFGMGIDRIVALLTQQTNLRDVVLFPLLKPEDERNQTTERTKKNQRIADTNVDSASLPDDKSKRFVAILNKKTEPGKLMNALGHMSAGLAGEAGDASAMAFLEYNDKDGGVHPAISQYPFIVLKADNSNQIRTVRNEAMKLGIPFNDFTSTMTVGLSADQQARTKETAEQDLEYYGICLFGSTDELKNLTKKFSLYS